MKDFKDENQAYENTDTEIWRLKVDDEYGDSYYSPSIHVTKNNLIGINVGGHVIVQSVEDWHKAAKLNTKDNGRNN